MANLDMIFQVVVPVYRFVKIWNSPQFPAEFRNAQLKWHSTFPSSQSLILPPILLFPFYAIPAGGVVWRKDPTLKILKYLYHFPVLAKE